MKMKKLILLLVLMLNNGVALMAVAFQSPGYFYRIITVGASEVLLGYGGMRWAKFLSMEGDIFNRCANDALEMLRNTNADITVVMQYFENSYGSLYKFESKKVCAGNDKEKLSELGKKQEELFKNLLSRTEDFLLASINDEEKSLESGEDAMEAFCEWAQFNYAHRIVSDAYRELFVEEKRDAVQQEFKGPQCLWKLGGSFIQAYVLRKNRNAMNARYFYRQS